MRIVAARKCEVKLLGHEEAQSFVDEWHRQGAVKGGDATRDLGLFLDGELLGVVQFAHPRTAEKRRRYSTELLRMAFKGDVRVQGGASKLVAYYRSTYNPADMFTYQDTTGDASAVYEHCGFTLVEEGGEKQYLVAPGKTLKTGSRKEVLGMAYAVRYGPDRILGTKLGEVFTDDGKRKPNKQLFTDELGWHVEVTTGDKVYEWFNANYTFYTYRITAADSDKYYYGVSHIKKPNATPEDCQAHHYFGSGGKNPENKFNLWRKNHEGKLAKEVLGVYSKKAEAYGAEAHLVGNLWETDPLCLNSTSGGKSTPPNVMSGSRRATCSIHGEAFFMGDQCRSCMVMKQETVQECVIHGQGSHFAGHCRKCMFAKSVALGECGVHGESLFQRGGCLKCKGEAKISLRHCPVHGEAKHIGMACCLCTSASVFTTKRCPTHGETKFVGDKCSRCVHQASFTFRTCAIHGETKHKGDVCSRCSRAKGKSQRDCPTHGKTEFQGDSCVKCTRAVVSFRICEIHGEVKHQGPTCLRCSAAKGRGLAECATHGLTAHNGKACMKCAGEKRAHGRYHRANPKPECSLCAKESAS